MIHQVEKVLTCGHLTTEETALELENRALARRIAGEAIVLLENKGVLPLDTTRPVALFGVGSTNTIKGGSGSGEVNERYSVTIYEGMKNAGFVISDEELLKRYDADAKQYRRDYEARKLKTAGFLNVKSIGMSRLEQGFKEKEFYSLSGRSKQEVDKAAPEADTCIYVIGRISGEDADRKFEKGDYFLSDTEEVNLRWCAENYKNVILVFNAGGPVDLSSVDDIDLAAILNMGMLGEEGGNAFADVITGAVSPSGHLTGSWAEKYDDIPFSDTFSGLDGDPKVGDYNEDIFVGYRYFERFGVKPRFCFGQGLSYTTFALKCELEAHESIKAQVTVKNTGGCAGKCVAQLYISVPETRQYQPEVVLAGFAKTELLATEQESVLNIEVPWHYLASYSEELGGEYLEAGQYTVYLGQSVEDKQIVSAFVLEQEVLLQERKHICPLTKKLDLLKPESKKTVPQISAELMLEIDPELIRPEEITSGHNLMDDYESRAKEFADRLPVSDLPLFLTGTGVTDMIIPGVHDLAVPGADGFTTSKYNKEGYTSIAFADGPAGLRFSQISVVKKGAKSFKMVTGALDMLNFMPKAIRMLGYAKVTDGTPIYFYATAFPTGTALAQTWNEKLVEEMGYAVGNEMEEYGVNVWLAPGMNIHRNPLCGRNYEYYSEDPLLTGKTGSVMIRGVQAHPGRYATIKHFCCNNQENERQWTSANVSERALREIYLKGFGMVVKEADCRALMSSYNRINEVWSGVNKDTLTVYLREECGFKGIVTTDWDGSHEGLEAEKSIDAGITLLMAGDGGQRKAIANALKEGRLDEALARERVKTNLQVILASTQA